MQELKVLEVELLEVADADHFRIRISFIMLAFDFFLQSFDLENIHCVLCNKYLGFGQQLLLFVCKLIYFIDVVHESLATSLLLFKTKSGFFY